MNLQRSRWFVLAGIALTLMLALAGCGGPSATSTMRIVAPADGATVKGPKVKFDVAVTDWKLVPAGGAINDGEGHLHFFVDQPAASVAVGQPVPATTDNPAYIHAGKDPLTSRELNLSPGKHTITVVMGNAAHAALSSPAPQTITINVE
jgi:hypothetical protein